MATNPTSKRKINVLFIHQNFPGQFWHLASTLSSDESFNVLAIGKAGCPALPALPIKRYRLHRNTTKEIHRYVRSFESGVLHGQAVLRLLLEMKTQGYCPDVIVAHTGWGETLFVKEAYPNVRLICLCEFYYHPTGADVGFDAEFPVSIDSRANVRAKNALLLLGLENADIAISPTTWQKSLHPPIYHDKIQVIHEGIDTDTMCPDPDATFCLPNGRILCFGDQVVTYVARNLEPYRGFHIFMRALPLLLQQNPECIVVIVGGDDVSYGSRPKDARNWRLKMLSELQIDLSRVFFLGKIPYLAYRDLLRVSAAHVYLTYPFVLSWSMLEAMACGCLLIASHTDPVEEVIVDGVNGRLFDFFDHLALARLVGLALRDNPAHAVMRSSATRLIKERYSLKKALNEYRNLLTMHDEITTPACTSPQIPVSKMAEQSPHKIPM